MIIASDVHLPPGMQLRLPEEILSASVLVANLEAPLVDGSGRKKKKAGPLLINDQRSIVQDFPNQTVFFTANNHIADFGLDGIVTTIKALNQNCFGVWVEGDTPRSHLDFSDEGVCLIATGEYGFLLPEGVLQLDPLSGQVEREIDSARTRGLGAIVLYHGGFEGTPIPSPALKNRFRGWIERGAMAVLCHHSHVLSYYESYLDGVIDYGMGNFVVPPADWEEYHPFSLLSRTWSLVEGKLEPKLYQIEPGGSESVIRVSTLGLSEAHDAHSWLKKIEALASGSSIESVIRTLGRVYWLELYKKNLSLAILQSFISGFPRLKKFLATHLPGIEKEFFIDLVGGESNRLLAMSGSVWDHVSDQSTVALIKELNLAPNSWLASLPRI